MAIQYFLRWGQFCGKERVPESADLTQVLGQVLSFIICLSWTIDLVSSSLIRGQLLAYQHHSFVGNEV